MPEFSVVTLVKARRKQLANLLDSVKASTVLPNDVQVVLMDNSNGVIIPEGLSVSVQVMEDAPELPLAAARNRGIAAAETDNIIFIDVDCIVSPTLFANMLMELKADHIIAGYPLYLPLLPDTGQYHDLKNKAVAHPDREKIPAGQVIQHLQFWSLIFAIQKQTFEKIGGFDESFTGYGAEDTDFAMMFHKAGVKQIFVRDFILHQYHDKYDPPLNYFDSIIENSTRYQQKWGVLPMQRWLKAFATIGLVEIGENDIITILQKPTESQIQSSISANPY